MRLLNMLMALLSTRIRILVRCMGVLAPLMALADTRMGTRQPPTDEAGAALIPSCSKRKGLLRGGLLPLRLVKRILATESQTLFSVQLGIISNQTFSVTNAGSMKIKALYYPRWHAFMGDESLPVAPASDGSIVVSVARAGEIRLVWIEPLAVQAAKVLSLIIWCLLLSILAFYSFRRRATAFSPITEPIEARPTKTK
jgi:hypothetical protein